MWKFNKFSIGEIVKHTESFNIEFSVIDILSSEPEKIGQYLYCCKVISTNAKDLPPQGWETAEDIATDLNYPNRSVVDRIYKYAEKDLLQIRIATSDELDTLLKDALIKENFETAHSINKTIKKLKSKINIEETKITSIHEAAHAAICLQYHVSFKYVSIIPGKDYSGKLLHDKKFVAIFQDTSIISETKKFSVFQKYIMCALAGYVAEDKINSKNRSIHASQDYANAYSQCGKFFGNMETSEAFLNYICCLVKDNFTYLISEAEDEPEDSELWKFVLILSNELILKKELSFKICKKLFTDFSSHEMS